MIVKNKARSEPKIPDSLEPVTPEVLAAADLAGVVLADLVKSDAQGMALEQSVIRSCSFVECKAQRMRLYDVIVDGSDLSNADLSGALFDTVRIENSKLMGARVIEGRIKDALFRLCNGRYSQFRMARLSFSEFEECDFRDADFYGSDLGGVRFCRCDLRGVDFSQCKMAGTDIRGCEIEGIKTDIESVKGLVIDMQQAAYFVHLLGIRVKN